MTDRDKEIMNCLNRMEANSIINQVMRGDKMNFENREKCYDKIMAIINNAYLDDFIKAYLLYSLAENHFKILFKGEEKCH